eukprot:TRINITY_DN7085_c0_g1_i1.p1 TRINITY_DN7085_c0_g1~~TRINITY_DN7085_c0_g1_i1.p1  ORF type:complete len:1111 (-),score=277.32 TRINITY_DN7085_c0_g1_i1:60-3392(-)
MESQEISLGSSSPSKELKDESERFKICVLGAERTGKTALVTRFLTGEFIGSNADVPTIQNNRTKAATINGKPCIIELLDTGGSPQVYADRHEKWIEWAEAFIICFDITSRSSFETANALKRNIDKIKKFEEIPTFLVGTNSDKESRRKVVKQSAEKAAKTLNCSYVEVSNQNGQNVEAVFANLVKDLRALRTKKVVNPIFGASLHKVHSFHTIPDLEEINPGKQRSITIDGQDADEPDENILSTSPSQRSDFRRGISKPEDRPFLKSTTMRKLGNMLRRKRSSSGELDSETPEKNEGEDNEFMRKTLLQRTDWSEFECTEPNSMVALDGAKLGYHFEVGKDEVVTNTAAYPIEDNEKDIPYYAKYFHKRDHYLFIYSEDGDRTAILALRSPSKEGTEDKKGLLFTKQGTERFHIPAAHSTSVSDMLKFTKSTHQNLDIQRFIEIVDIDELSNDLVSFEKRQISMLSTYKFGVLFMADGQTEEDAMFSNERSSPDFDQFLRIIGERVVLEGFGGYRGGLDTRFNSTGTHTVTAKHEEFDIMFHVSTLLPYQPDDKQRVERKRHLGNDIVMIIFKSDDTPFDPTCLASQFNHIFAVVQKDSRSTPDQTFYKVAFASRTGVKPFGPLLKGNIFKRDEAFRSFLLTKLINGERAALRSPVFRQKLERTRKELLADMVKTHLKPKLTRKNSVSERKRTDSTSSDISYSTDDGQSQELPIASSPSPNSEEAKKLLKHRGLKDKLRFGKEKSQSDLPLRAFIVKLMNLSKRVNEWTQAEISQFDSYEFLYALNQTAQTIVSEGLQLVDPQIREHVNEVTKRFVAIGSRFLYSQELRRSQGSLSASSSFSDLQAQVTKSVSADSIVGDNVKELFVESLTRLLLAFESASKSQEDRVLKLSTSGDLEDERKGKSERKYQKLKEKQNSKQLKAERKEIKKREVQEKRYKKSQEQETKKRGKTKLPETNLLPSTAPRNSLSESQDVSDLEEAEDVFLGESEVFAVQNTYKEAEQIAAKLVQVLASTEMKLEDLSDHLRNLGNLSKDINRMCEDSTSEEHIVRLMESTQSLLKAGLELKKEEEHAEGSRSSSKRKDLLSAVNSLLGAMQEILIEQELSMAAF